jgi:hypothetical protein
MNNSTSKWPEGYKGFVSAVSPNPPVLISAEGSCSSVTLSWSYISNPCMPITNFNIYKNDKFVLRVPYTTTTINVNNLKLNTVYSFYVTSSINTVAESIPSNTLSATTLNIFPPQNLSGTSGCGSVNLNWDPPSSTTCIITDYQIYYGEGTYITSVPYPELSITINGLDYNTQYSFYVTSYNSIVNYQSTPSNVCPLTTQSILPPQDLSGNSGCGSVTLNWEPPSSTTCSITDYLIYNDGTYITSVPYLTTTYTVTGLDYNTQYSFYVTSYNSSNANHQSIPSNVFTLTTLSLLPPQDLSGNSGCGSVTLIWTPPSFTTCITDYLIYYGDGTYITDVSYLTTTYTVTGLDYNTQYSFYVTSYNSNTHNQSAQSIPFSLTTLNLLPPQDLSGNSSSQSITLIWTPPSSTTCITDYQIYYEDGTYITDVSSNVTTYTVTGLDYNTQYSFYVTSYNSSANYQSVQSNTFTATTSEELFTAIGNYTVYNNNSFTGIVFDASSVSQSLTLYYPQLVTLIVIGGGGGGTSGSFNASLSNYYPVGGGGGGITYIQNLYLDAATYTINVGFGGQGILSTSTLAGQQGLQSDFDSYISYGGYGGGENENYFAFGGGVNTVYGGGGGMSIATELSGFDVNTNNIISGTNSNAGNQGSILPISSSQGGNSFYANNSIPIFVPFDVLCIIFCSICSISC